MILGPCLAIGLALLFTVDAYTGRSAWGLWALAVVVTGRATWELCQLMRVRSFVIQPWLVQLGSFLVISSNWLERIQSPEQDLYVRTPAALGPAMLVLALVFLLLMGFEALRFQQPGHSMESLGAEFFIVTYAGVLLTFLVQLRWVAGSQIGYLALGSVVVVPKAGDIGGYFLGKFFGRAKLIPKLSPGKTWMGGLGALLGAALGSLVWFEGIGPLMRADGKPAPIVWVIVYGGVIGVVGLIGDLCESLIKRDTGQKDSAELLPEFGGMLDVVDSVIYASPMAYLLWLILPLS